MLFVLVSMEFLFVRFDLQDIHRFTMLFNTEAQLQTYIHLTIAFDSVKHQMVNYQAYCSGWQFTAASESEANFSFQPGWLFMVDLCSPFSVLAFSASSTCQKHTLEASV
jgi:hypothetical protein